MQSRLDPVVRVVFHGDVLGDVLLGAALIFRGNFFAGVENIFGVKDIFYLFKNFYDVQFVHFRKVWCADDAVIVLGGNRAMILGH